MKQILAGIMITLGVGLISKGSYELGKIDERIRNNKQWKEVNDELDKIIVVLEKKVEESKRNA